VIRAAAAQRAGRRHEGRSPEVIINSVTPQGRSVENVPRVTAELLLEVGARNLRTALIAERAGITESTLFRHYSGGLGQILRATYDWCWDEVNRAVMRSQFASPGVGARQILLSDTDAIWRMRDDPETAVAAYCAFLFARRRQELDIDEPCHEQELFEKRLFGLCQLIVRDQGLNDSTRPGLITSLVTNYIATVFLTWFAMPVGSADVTENHDLTVDEAQLGILLLLDRDYSTGVDGLLSKAL